MSDVYARSVDDLVQLLREGWLVRQSQFNGEWVAYKHGESARTFSLSTISDAIGRGLMKVNEHGSYVLKR